MNFKINELVRIKFTNRFRDPIGALGGKICLIINVDVNIITLYHVFCNNKIKLFYKNELEKI